MGRTADAEFTGETVARAKRTDRAEARRRYRAELAGPDGLDDEGTEAEEAAPPSQAGRGRPSAGKQTTQPVQTGRIGIRAAFRQSIHPLNVRDDLATFPGLVTHKAVWVPALLTLIAAVLFAATPNQFSYLLMQYFLWAPPIAAVFIGGFLAPRSSWLIGVVLGILASLLFTILLVSGVYNQSIATIIGATPTPVDATIPANLYPVTIVQWFVTSTVAGALFAAGAAWYRRFLQLSNPNRGRQAPRRGGSGAGRSRSSGTAKTR